MKKIIKCPEGHPCVQCPEGHTVECPDCGLIATSWNAKTGEVYGWMDYDDYIDACHAMGG